MPRIITLVLTACLMAHTAFAQELLIITEENPPFNFTENGQATGFSVDMLLLAAKKAGIDINREDILFWPWARGYQAAQQKDNVILFSTARTKQREKLFQWIGPIMPLQSSLYSLKGAAIHFTDLPSAANTYRIGTLRDSGSEQFLIKNGIPPEKMQRIHSQELNIKKLLDGRIDIMPALEANFLYNLKRMGQPEDSFENVKSLVTVDLFFATSKGMAPAIVKRLQQALDRLKEDGTVDAIINGYLR